MAKKKKDSDQGSADESTEEQDLSGLSGADRLREILKSTLVQKIRKRHGDRILIQASQADLKRRMRISTGIFPLDVALGGGFPVGMISTVWGHKSSAKTTVVLRAIAEAQKVCGNCYTGYLGNCKCGNFREIVAAFIDAEGTLDLEWAVRQGVDLDRLMLSTPEYAEQTMDLGEQLLRSGHCDLLAIDSLAFLVPIKEIEESTEKELPGLQARAVGKGIRKFTAALNERGADAGRRPTVLFTNQVRHKVGVMFGSPETKPAGFAPGFAAVVEVRMKPGKYEMDEGVPVWVDLGFKVDKNKASVPMIEGVFRLMLQDTETKKLGDIYDEQNMLAEAVKIGLVSKNGTKWECMGEEYKAKSLIERKLLLDLEFKSQMRQALFTILMH